MNSEKLVKARAFEKEMGEKISKEERPKFHLSPYVGWMNDPNGFSYYKGEYHMFYQYYPYKSVWGPMHWGHAVSKDLLHWTYLPAAMAPDQEYDLAGCFSGSAIELPDGRQLLLYTGVQNKNGKDLQTQCVALGDGQNYEKYEKNPVLDETDLPEGKSRHDFRDPKIWKEADGSYRCVVGGRDKEKKGCILLFSSPDGLDWKFESILAENDGRFGLMWECPDFFELSGKYVLLTSPQDMLPEGLEYHNGNGTLCLIGEYDKEKKHFLPEKNQAIDYGIDFYASQTIETPDGRRIMIGWMQNWDTCSLIGTSDRKWFGQMSLPRELTIKEGRLFQQPIHELEHYRSNKVEYKNVRLQGEMTLEGIEGRIVDMEIRIRPSEKEKLYQKFAVRFAQNDTCWSSVSFRPHESILKVDRKFSGSRRAYIHQRRCLVSSKDDVLKLRLIIDRFSVEVFVNDGEQVMTATILTDPSAKGISFFSIGETVFDVIKYDLFAEDQ